MKVDKEGVAVLGDVRPSEEKFKIRGGDVTIVIMNAPQLVL